MRDSQSDVLICALPYVPSALLLLLPAALSCSCPPRSIAAPAHAQLHQAATSQPASEYNHWQHGRAAKVGSGKCSRLPPPTARTQCCDRLAGVSFAAARPHPCMRFGTCNVHRGESTSLPRLACSFSESRRVCQPNSLCTCHSLLCIISSFAATSCCDSLKYRSCRQNARPVLHLRG